MKNICDWNNCMEIGEFKAPIEKDQEIGSLILKSIEDEETKIPVYASKEIKKVNFFKSLFLSFNYIYYRSHFCRHGM